MSSRDEPPDADRLARLMLAAHGFHDGPHPNATGRPTGPRSQVTTFANDPQRLAAVRAATRAERDRYLTSGLQPVHCRFCQARVQVKKLGPGHTAVQWNTEASQRCAYFAAVRAAGGDSARSRACPKLSDSIEHAVAEGCLDAGSTAPSPGDG
ncbi:hypothetical protein [Mycobacterium sp.]|uniref:hypothetical protein n=1 Tax=Mycobacterium sp. TaxID=1785 RepID=UPI0012775363|nr:hypothetical protein [Mycobacterium sp.]KAA8969483.1 MAG: hypothetical protein F6Q13_02965 [Mycobacterium sp.]